MTRELEFIKHIKQAFTIAEYIAEYVFEKTKDMDLKLRLPYPLRETFSLEDFLIEFEIYNDKKSVMIYDEGHEYPTIQDIRKRKELIVGFFRSDYTDYGKYVLSINNNKNNQ